MPRFKDIPLEPFPWESPDGERHCQHPGCESLGGCPAPYRINKGEQHGWFCLEHARLYNEAWDYFADMSSEEIEYHRRQDVVGWRPSWPLGKRNGSVAGIADPFSLEDISDDHQRTGGDSEHADGTPLDYRSDVREALAVLDMSAPVTYESLKARYKKLVKQLHPDANGGDRRCEERFKRVNDAYQCLRAFLGEKPGIS